MVAALLTLAGCESGGETVGPRGGTVVSADGRFSVEVRPGALEDEVEIAIEEVGCDSMGAPALGPCYEVGPTGVGFLFPAKITFELEGDTHDGIDADELVLIAAHGDEWAVLADRHLDLEDGTISGSSAYLSAFAVAQKHH
jgi:hypothetical protein